MSPVLRTILWPRIRFPRVSGDEPGYRETSRTVGGFSPRERG